MQPPFTQTHTCTISLTLITHPEEGIAHNGLDNTSSPGYNLLWHQQMFGCSSIWTTTAGCFISQHLRWHRVNGGRGCWVSCTGRIWEFENIYIVYNVPVGGQKGSVMFHVEIRPVAKNIIKLFSCYRYENFTNQPHEEHECLDPVNCCVCRLYDSRDTDWLGLCLSGINDL